MYNPCLILSLWTWVRGIFLSVRGKYSLERSLTAGLITWWLPYPVWLCKVWEACCNLCVCVVLHITHAERRSMQRHLSSALLLLFFLWSENATTYFNRQLQWIRKRFSLWETGMGRLLGMETKVVSKIPRAIQTEQLVSSPGKYAKTTLTQWMEYFTSPWQVVYAATSHFS